jgi:hypothetical protein
VQEKPDHHNRLTAHLLQSSCNAKCPSSSRATIFRSRMKIVHVLRILHACTMVINFCYSSSTQKTMDSPCPTLRISRFTLYTNHTFRFVIKCTVQ